MTERNPFKSKKRRQELRRFSTREEKLFWEAVRGNRLGFKVRRQYGIGPYILDFYIPQSQIAIEIDGGIHLTKEVAENDKNKDIFLKENGIKVLRFSNELVHNEMEKVISEIKNTVQSGAPPVFPYKRGRTLWMDHNHLESPPPDAGGDRGGQL